MNEYEIIKYPKSRIGTFDVGVIGRKKHHIIGLIEIDMTDSRKKIKDKIKNGEKTSLNSWIIKVISQTIHENRYIQAINYKKGKQLIFNDVDISMTIEKEVDGRKVPLVTVLRKVNEKSIEDIYNEIENIKRQKVLSRNDYVLGNKKQYRYKDIFYNLPQFLRMFLWQILLSNPFRQKNSNGTVMVSNIGGIGSNPGWIIPKSIHNICFGIGSICKKAWVINNEVKIREILNMTILINHDNVDGIPATKFTDKLVKNIEKGYLI